MMASSVGKFVMGFYNGNHWKVNENLTRKILCKRRRRMMTRIRTIVRRYKLCIMIKYSEVESEHRIEGFEALEAGVKSLQMRL